MLEVAVKSGRWALTHLPAAPRAAEPTRTTSRTKIGVKSRIPARLLRRGFQVVAARRHLPDRSS